MLSPSGVAQSGLPLGAAPAMFVLPASRRWRLGVRLATDAVAHTSALGGRQRLLLPRLLASLVGEVGICHQLPAGRKASGPTVNTSQGNIVAVPSDTASNRVSVHYEDYLPVSGWSCAGEVQVEAKAPLA